jgi:hypothetical protein
MLGRLPLFARNQGIIRSLSWSLLLMPGGYNGSGTWTGTASAGTSGSTNLVDSGSNPPGLTSNYATFNGSTQLIISTLNVATLIAQAGSTIISIVRFHATGPTGDNAIPNLGMYLGQGNNAFGLVHGADTTDGVKFYAPNSSNSSVATAKSAVSLNTWYMHIGRWTGGADRSRLNTTDATDGTLSGGAGSNVTALASLLIGRSSGSNYQNMDLRFVAIAPSIISDADCTSIYNEAVGQGWLT